MLAKYKNMTKAFEGLRLKPYKCTAGKLTIGYGRNLEDAGISQAEADMMFERDFAMAESEVKRLCKANQIDWENLIEQRFYVLTDMMCNVGYNRLSKFNKFLYALKTGSYTAAADEMLDSVWAKQVGNRATQLSALMRG